MWSRLDRLLVSSEWETHFLDVCQKRLTCLGSDHFPIFLDYGGLSRGCWCFKFDNIWLKSEAFVERVQ